MSYMSYCMFEGTCKEMQQCADAIYCEKKLSEDEKKYAQRLFELANEYIENVNTYGIVTEEDDYDENN